jgi:hypothetical protein
VDVSELLDFKRGVSHRRGGNDGAEATMGDSALLRCCFKYGAPFKTKHMHASQILYQTKKCFSLNKRCCVWITIRKEHDEVLGSTPLMH